MYLACYPDEAGEGVALRGHRCSPAQYGPIRRRVSLFFLVTFVWYQPLGTLPGLFELISPSSKFRLVPEKVIKKRINVCRGRRLLRITPIPH
jgi:hypothetical protein